MTDSEYSVEVDLGKKPSKTDNMPMAADEKKGEPYYPTLYISDAPKELGDLPEEGTVLIKYKLESVTKRAGGKGGNAVSVELKVMKICMPESDNEDDGEDSDDMEGLVDRMAKKAGVKTSGDDSEADTGDDEDTE